VRRKLEEANLAEPGKINKDTGLREDAMLKIHIVDAINLGTFQTTFVQLRQHEMQAKTKEMYGTGPIWNEGIVFDIKDESHPLVVTLMDTRGTNVFTSKIPLEDEKDYREMNQDIWLPQGIPRPPIERRDLPQPPPGQDGKPSLRIRITYHWSDIYRFENMLDEWHETI
jgi:hypothetical protein